MSGQSTPIARAITILIWVLNEAITFSFFSIYLREREAQIYIYYADQVNWVVQWNLQQHKNNIYSFCKTLLSKCCEEAYLVFCLWCVVSSSKSWQIWWTIPMSMHHSTFLYVWAKISYTVFESPIETFKHCGSQFFPCLPWVLTRLTADCRSEIWWECCDDLCMFV